MGLRLLIATLLASHPTLKVIAHNINHHPMLIVGGHPTTSTGGHLVLQPSGNIVQKIIQ